MRTICIDCSPEMLRALRETCSTPAPMPKQAKVVCAVACGMWQLQRQRGSSSSSLCRDYYIRDMYIYLSISIRYILVRLVAVVIAVVGQATSDKRQLTLTAI